MNSIRKFRTCVENINYRHILYVRIVETMSYSDKVANFLDAPSHEVNKINMADLELIAGDVIEKVRSRSNSPLGTFCFLTIPIILCCIKMYYFRLEAVVSHSIGAQSTALGSWSIKYHLCGYRTRPCNKITFKAFNTFWKLNQCY